MTPPIGGVMADLKRAIDDLRKLMEAEMTPATLSTAHMYRVTHPPQTGAQYLALMTMIDKIARLEDVLK